MSRAAVRLLAVRDRSAALGATLRTTAARRGGGGEPGAGPRRPPPVEVEVGPCLPGTAVRLLPAALLAVLGLALDGGDAAWALLGVAALLLLARPTWVVAGPLVLLVGLVVLGGPSLLPTPGGAWPSGDTAGGGDAAAASGLAPVARLAAVVLVVDLTLRAASLAAHTAWGSRVEWAVLGRLGRSVAATQLVAQPVLGLAYATGTLADGAGPGWLRPVAVVTAGVLLALALRPYRAR